MSTGEFIKFIQLNNDRILSFNRMIGGYEIFTNQKQVQEDVVNEDKVSIYNDKTIHALQNQILQNATTGRSLKCLELSVSEQCNFRCTYCTFWRNKKESGPSLMAKDLSYKAISDFICITKDIYSPLIYFGTAEPLLNWDVIQYSAKIARKLRPDIRLNLITNGSLMDIEKLQFCQQYDISVGLSLDGTPKTQLSQRKPISNSIDSYQVVINLLEVGKKIRYSFSCLSCTYQSPDFLYDVRHLIDLCLEYNISELDLDYDSNSVTDSNNAELVSDNLAISYHEVKNADLDIFGYWLIPFLNILNQNKQLKSFCGNVTGESVCVTSDGGFKLCGYESQEIERYSSLIEHLSSSSFYRTCRDHLAGNNKACDGCFIEGVCAGQCIVRKPYSPNWRSACELYRKSTRKLLQYL